MNFMWFICRDNYCSRDTQVHCGRHTYWMMSPWEI